MAENERYVLITGSAGGIGKACVNLFFTAGWRVIGVDVNEYGAGFPENGLFIKADISRADQFQLIFEKVTSLTSTLHALINNAAVQVSKPLVETTVEEWDTVIATNLRPVFLSARLFPPAAGKSWRQRHCQCLLCSCHPNLHQHCRLRRQQGGHPGAHARHGNRVRQRQYPCQRGAAWSSGHTHAAQWAGPRSPCRTVSE